MHRLLLTISNAITRNLRPAFSTKHPETHEDSILIYGNYSQWRTRKKNRITASYQSYDGISEGVEGHSRAIPGIKEGSIVAPPPRHSSPPAIVCTWIIYKRLSRRMAADVSLVYLSTVSTILYFSSCTSSSHSVLRRSTTATLPSRSTSADLTTLRPVSSPFSHASLVPATEGCHTGLTRCICLSRTLLPRRRIGVPYQGIPDACRDKKSQPKSVQDNAARRGSKNLIRKVAKIFVNYWKFRRGILL